MATRKTKKMIAVEERFRQPLEKMLPEMVTEPVSYTHLTLPTTPYV